MLSHPCLLSLYLFFFFRPTKVGIKKKLERRDRARETKALSAAKLERSIEAELLSRLKSKAYGDAPLNVNEDVWRAVLERERLGDEEDMEDMEDEDSGEEDMDSDEEEMEEELEGGEREFVEDDSDFDEDDDEDDMEDYSGEEVSGMFCFTPAFCSLSSPSFIPLLHTSIADTDFRLFSASFDFASQYGSFEEGSGLEDGSDDESAEEGPSGKRKAAAPPPSSRQQSAPAKKAKKAGGAGPRVEIEYEQETEPMSKEMLDSW